MTPAEAKAYRGRLGRDPLFFYEECIRLNKFDLSELTRWPMTGQPGYVSFNCAGEGKIIVTPEEK